MFWNKKQGAIKRVAKQEPLNEDNLKMLKEITIAEEYREFVDLANELANKEYPNPHALSILDKKESRYTRHIIGMLEMYHIRYGDPEERLRIVEFLEERLFNTSPTLREISDWRNLRKLILSGEYKDFNSEASQQ